MQISSVLRYQDVGIGNAKLWRWVSKPTPVLNANGFASQWNIGLIVIVVIGQNVPNSNNNSDLFTPIQSGKTPFLLVFKQRQLCNELLVLY